MSSRPLAFCAALALGMIWSGSAAAQRSGFGIDRFEPAERGSQMFVVDTLDIRGSGRPALGAVLDYGYKPLVFYDKDGNEKSAIVRHQLFTHLGGDIVLADRLRLALNVPIALYQDGEESVVNGETLKPADKPAVGDVRLAADLRVVGQTTDPFTFAIGLRGWLPTGQRSEFTGDGSARVGPQVLVAGDLGILVYGARLAVVYRARDDAYAGAALGSELLGAAGVGLKTADRRLVVGPEIYATSTFTQNGTGDSGLFRTRETPAEWLFGLHYAVTNDIHIGAGVGSGLTRGYGAPQLRTVALLEWAPAYEKPDRDRDGVPDDEDACPDMPGIQTKDPATNGCPPPPPDRDRDGIADPYDACPDVPGVPDVDPHKNGCPPDRDGDGIPDVTDACPEVKGVADPDPHKNGCPPDRDNDGVYDHEDACPDTPGVRTTDPKTNGCPPPPPDTDGDGILDVDDACPKVAGPANPDPKKNGCPLVFVTEKEIKITEQVKFKFNSADILKESDPLLEGVAKVLKDHPEIKKVRVEGHTDNVGNKDYNLDLSKRRAASVMKWLTDHGVDKSRLASQGFGMTEPIDTNETDAGRANNRRVAFTILERDDSKAAQPPPTPPQPPPPTPAVPPPAPKP